jgi:O-antigen/teichoic acid export membrane protein
VLSLRAGGAFVQFCFQILIARQWGLENFGLFSVAFTVTIVSSMVARWGADQWVLRELSATNATGSARNFVSVLINGMMLVLATSALVTLFLWCASGSIAYFLISRKPGVAEELVQIMTLSIIPFALINFLCESLRAVNKHLLATLLQTVLVPSLSVLLLFGFSLVSARTLTQVADAYVIACLLTFLAGALCLRRVYRVRAGTGQFVWIFKEVAGETTSIAVVVLLSTWLAYADILILGYFHGPSEVGLYAAAQRLSLLFGFVLVSLNSLLGPKFALLIKQGQNAEVFSLYRRSLKWTVLIGLPILVLLAVFSRWFLSWFGSNFASAQYILLILLAGQLINMLTGPVGVIMMMGRHAATMRVYVSITALTHIPAALVLTSFFGAAGAAAATSTSMVLLNLLCWRFVVTRSTY